VPAAEAEAARELVRLAGLKTVLTDSTGQVGIEVPRDRAGTSGPQIVKKRQRRLTGVDETVSRITDKVIEEMQSWQNRPLDEIYAAIFVDAIVVKIRDGQGPNRPVYAALGVTVDGRKDILGLWAGTSGEVAEFWMSVLLDMKTGVCGTCSSWSATG
jgi:putative transposase